MLVGAVVTIGFQLAAKNHDITELKNRIMRLEQENKEHTKSISDRKVVLEQLKDGSRILREAKKLGLRLPANGQNVKCLQVVIHSDDMSLPYHQKAGQGGTRDWRLASRN
jgi:cell division protein FtsL